MGKSEKFIIVDGGDRTHDPKTHGLSTTPFVKEFSGVLVCLTTCNWLTNSLPKLSLITLSYRIYSPLLWTLYCRRGSGLRSAISSSHSPNSPSGLSFIFIFICVHGSSGWASVMVSPLPRSGIIIYAGCSLLPERSIACLNERFRPPFCQKALGGQQQVIKGI